MAEPSPTSSGGGGLPAGSGFGKYRMPLLGSQDGILRLWNLWEQQTVLSFRVLYK